MANKNTQQQRPGKVLSKIVLQNVRRMRYDIAQWRQALKIAESVDNPNRARLYDIYIDTGLDALLTSQLQNRKLQTLGTSYEIVNEAGELDDQYTKMFQGSTWFPLFLSQLLDTPWWGHSLWEITGNTFDNLVINLIPRKHVKPQAGEVLEHEYDTNGMPYRTMREYGRYLIEAGDNYDVGLLNKAVPHVLMKRFSQSCWSEFCEIFGMPMRTLKTNTSDPEMLNRAEEMMRAMGAANYSIIDESEILEYAEANNATGDVYKYLIALCNNEISMLVLGSILGQDTEHGTRGKEQVSFDILSNLVKADNVGSQNYVNSTLFPALAASGFIPENISFRYKESVDLEALWAKVKEALQHYDIPVEWIEDKFGIPVTPKQYPGTFGAPNLHANGFFG